MQPVLVGNSEFRVIELISQQLVGITLKKLKNMNRKKTTAKASAVNSVYKKIEKTNQPLVGTTLRKQKHMKVK